MARPSGDSGDVLPVVADTPSPDPGMGFEAYAAAIALAVRGGAPPQFTVGIYGAWGSGKSSLLNAVRKELSRDPSIATVAFDAWRYERAPHIIVPLMNAVYAAVPSLSDQPLTERVRTALASVARSISFSLGPIGIDLGAAAAPGDDAYAEALNAAYAQPYADMRAVGEMLDGRRIVVLVDDLDRCSPDKVVALLEAINLVMDVPGFVFVLALDYDVLVAAVGARYPHVSGHVFIEKMVQVPFRVPRLDIKPELFLQDLMPGWPPPGAATLPHGFTDIAYDVATLGLAANPRQVKRFVNSLLLLLHIAAARGLRPQPRLVGGLVGLQLRWPAEYQDLTDAVYADDQDPLGGLTATDQADLGRYAEALFTPAPSNDELRGLLQLTDVVVQSDTVSGYQTGDYDSRLAVADVREHAAARIREVLLDSGYTESSRAGGIFSHPGTTEYRVRLGKAVLRFEGKDPGGRWLLAESHYLTRALPDVLDVVRDVDLLRSRVNAGIEASYGTDRLPRSATTRH